MFDKNILILGKFMPMHIGHEAMIKFAWNMFPHENVYVMVCAIKSEPIPGIVRLNVMHDFFHSNGNHAKNIIFNDDENPQIPEEHPDFWNIWKESITKRLKKVDYVIASESYGNKLAEVLGAKFIPFDPERGITKGISGTRLRKDVDLSKISKGMWRYYQRGIYVVGPESCGKTTLTKKLHDAIGHDQSTLVPEYARTYLETKNMGMNFTHVDFEFFYKGQYASIMAAYEQPRPYVIVDTDTITTSIYEDIYFPNRSVTYFSEGYLDDDCYNKSLYLLLTPNVKYVEDELRNLPDTRWDVYNEYVKRLNEYDIKFKVIDAEDYGRRFIQALQYVNEYLE